MKTFDSLTEQEILALAISLEEEDARIYEDFADGLQENYPEQAAKFRDHAPRRRRPPPSPARTLQIPLRRPRPAHPAAGRARLRGPQTRLAHPAARLEDRPENRRKHGGGNPPLLRGRRATAPPTPASANCSATSPKRNATTRTPPSKSRSTKLSEDEKSQRQAAVRPASHPTRTRRSDGRFRLHARAAVRRRVRHAQQLGHLSRRPGRQRRRGHQHGICRGAVRRRQPHRARPSVGARLRLRR